MNTKLCLHASGSAKATEVSRVELATTHTPTGQGIHRPIAHVELVNRVEQALENVGLVVTGEAHALTRSGDRYFGLMQVGQKKDDEVKDYSWVVGLRNAHDKCFPATVCAGTRVFVCDNLAFNGEIMMARRHTTNILRDLPNLATRVVGQLSAQWHDLDTRVKAYRGTQLEDEAAHDLVIRMLEAGVYGTTLIRPVLEQFRDPKHEEHVAEGHTAWTMMNAVTECLKGVSPFELGKRTTAMHAVLDAKAGLFFGKN